MADPVPPAATPRGVAVDALPGTRPGVPRERAQRDGGVSWELPEPQAPTRAWRPPVRTPVFGTGQPPRGLSGLVRRAAYRIPEHRAGRWALLVAGDRLDVLEHRLARALWVAPLALALAGGYTAARRALERR